MGITAPSTSENEIQIKIHSLANCYVAPNFNHSYTSTDVDNMGFNISKDTSCQMTQYLKIWSILELPIGLLRHTKKLLVWCNEGLDNRVGLFLF